MPAEIRHILFRPAEVMLAIREYHACMRQPIAPGELIDYETDIDASGRIARLRVTLETSTREELVVEANVLAAALILHCRSQRIPLSASAEKSMQRYGDQIALITTFNPKQLALPSRADLRTS